MTEGGSLVKPEGKRKKDSLRLHGKPYGVDARLSSEIERTVGCVKIPAATMAGTSASANATQDAVMGSQNDVVVWCPRDGGHSSALQCIDRRPNI